MRRSATGIAIGFAALILSGGPAAAQRQRLSMDPGWRFTLGDPAGAERPGFDDRSWRRLDLPHDWSTEGTPREDALGGGRVGYFPPGLGWYRKAFRLPTGSAGRTAWLEFDGIYMNSDVWINGVHLGRRPFGYIGLIYDVTRHLVPGNNLVAVRVDNSAQPNSRWYTGSGIYRHVWMTLVDPLHVGHWGTFVTTARADSAGAEVVVNTRVENDSEVPRRGLLRSVVLDSAGREVGRRESFFFVPAGRNITIEHRVEIAAPRLWSIHSPHLYTLRSEVHTRLRPTDQTTTTFGIRSIAYDLDQGAPARAAQGDGGERDSYLAQSARA